MKPTKQDLQFWESKKRPKWASLINKLQPGIKIDAVINSHSPRSKVDADFVAQSTMSLIRLHAKNKKCSLANSLQWLRYRSTGKRLFFVLRLIRRMEKVTAQQLPSDCHQKSGRIIQIRRQCCIDTKKLV